MEHPPREHPEKWLAFRLSAMGDVALTTGVLDYWLKTRGWKFTFLTYAPYSPVLENHPAVERIIPVTKGELRTRSVLSYFSRLAQDMRGYGLLDLHGTMRSRLLKMFWKGPVLSYTKYSFERRIFLRTNGMRGAENLLRHNVPQRYALAVEKTAPPRNELLPTIYLTEEERAWAKATVAEKLAGDTPLVALHPYSTHPNKAWLGSYWQRIAMDLLNEGYRVVSVGVGEPRFRGLRDLVDFTGKTDIRHTCALLEAADVLVTGDSGPMHLAGGVGTPVVALFGPTHKAWGFYPEGPRDIVLESEDSCRPCSLHGSKVCPNGRRCMESISPSDVMKEVEALVFR